tara:strand:+ start:348 stop:647 length:300 start_codon:yes stop_codon:yes gene_type:complete
MKKNKMDNNLASSLVRLFSIHFKLIENRLTRRWRLKLEDDGIYLECRNGTKNFITPDSCGELLETWNIKNPNFKLREVRRYCIEDDEVWTWIIWKLEKF